MKRLNVLGISVSFDEQGNLVDSQAQELVRELLAALGDWHRRVSNR